MAQAPPPVLRHGRPSSSQAPTTRGTSALIGRLYPGFSREPRVVEALPSVPQHGRPQAPTTRGTSALLGRLYLCRIRARAPASLLRPTRRECTLRRVPSPLPGSERREFILRRSFPPTPYPQRLASLPCGTYLRAFQRNSQPHDDFLAPTLPTSARDLTNQAPCSRPSHPPSKVYLSLEPSHLTHLTKIVTSCHLDLPVRESGHVHLSAQLPNLRHEGWCP